METLSILGGGEKHEDNPEPIFIGRQLPARAMNWERSETRLHLYSEDAADTGGGREADGRRGGRGSRRRLHPGVTQSPALPSAQGTA